MRSQIGRINRRALCRGPDTALSAAAGPQRRMARSHACLMADNRLSVHLFPCMLKGR